MAWRVLLALLHWPAAGAEVLATVRAAAARLVRAHAGGTLVSERFLLHRMAAACGLEDAGVAGGSALLRASEPVQDVMLRNLKSRVGWVEKKVNCDFLVAAVQERRNDGPEPGSYFANEVVNHLANLLKVSRVEGTRFHAGRCLLRLLPVLTVTQRNDLFVELVRSLQLDVEAVTRYIPRFLGPVIASLPEQEFNEALADIEVDVRRGNEPLQRLLLQTTVWVLLSLDGERLDAGVLQAPVRHAPRRPRRAPCEHRPRGVRGDRDGALPPAARPRRRPAAGPAARADLQEAADAGDAPGGRPRPLLPGRVGAQSHGPRRSPWSAGACTSPSGRRWRSCPGTFDPFTIAHAEVVSRVLTHVDEVMVQVDDYSWNKHAQPREVRKELAWMALSPMPGAFTAPFEPPVNLRNPASVRALQAAARRPPRRLRGRVGRRRGCERLPRPREPRLGRAAHRRRPRGRTVARLGERSWTGSGRGCRWRACRTTPGRCRRARSATPSTAAASSSTCATR